MVVDRCHDRWAAYLHERWSRDEAGVRSVLDICCGTGLMAAELVTLGYRVVGVDCSAAMLARARQRLGPDAVLAQQALPELGIDGVFDAGVCTFDGLNYLTPVEFGASLAAIANRLRVGGWLIFDLHTDAMMEFTVANPFVEGTTNGTHFAICSLVDIDSRSCDTRIEITGADGDTFSEHHRQYFLSDAHVREAIAAAGFGSVTASSEYTDDPIGQSTLRATWTARRTGRSDRSLDRD
jgi:SAM-dependent methyltransferase